MSINCSVCGKPITRGRFALAIGFHEKCNPEGYKTQRNAIQRVERSQHYNEVTRPARGNKVCSVCGKILRKGGTRIGHSELIGVHQKCDFPLYQRTWREARKRKTSK